MIEKNRTYHRSSTQTEKYQPEGKRVMSETRITEFSGIIRSPEGWDFSICIGDQCLIIFPTFDVKNIINHSSFLILSTFYIA